MHCENLTALRKGVTAQLATKDKVLFFWQNILFQPRFLDRERHRDLVEIGPLSRHIGMRVDGLRDVHPDLRKAAAIWASMLLGKAEQT